MSSILRPTAWIVENAPLDPRALANPLVAGEFGLEFYASVPLRTADGYNLGTLCILDFAPRVLTPSEVSTLRDLAATVVSELELRLASREAAAAAADRSRMKTA
ncbi:MAG TPA: GAF domain-containing protein, partial [Candidatus Saccharimonadales bacterium]|nr:GAF domain-containing protein [Candidatus Saccharimonadales bacterium]